MELNYTTRLKLLSSMIPCGMGPSSTIKYDNKFGKK